MGMHILHVEHAWLLALYTLLTVANSWMYKSVKGIHWFTLYNLFACLGAIAVALRGAIPDCLSIVGGNLFVIAAYFFLFVSLADLFGRKRPQIYFQVSLIVVGVVTMVLFGAVHDNIKYRLIAYSLVLGLQQAHIALFIFRKQDGTLRTVGTPMGLVMVALAITNLIRILGTFPRNMPANYLNAGPFYQSIVIANSCFQCGAMVAYVWMTAALLRNELETQASTDPLTGLLNRRAIELAAEREIATCNQLQTQLSAIVIDLDNFKRINDTFGHHCGDATLIAVANCLNSHMRKSDHLARLGGDEFVVLLPRAPMETALEIAERIRSSIANLEIVYGPMQAKVTASFGLAQARSAPSWEQLLITCDQALYAVKKEGGNLAMQGSDRSSGLLPSAPSA